MKRLVISTILLLSTTTFAHAAVKFNLSVKLMDTTWSGNNSTQTENFKTKSTQGAWGVGMQINRLYARIAVQGANFEFSDPAPNQETETTSTIDNDVTIEHGESDIIVGYYFWPKISLFADIKSVVNKRQGSNYEMAYSGLGVGVSGFHPIKQKWMIYVSSGLLLPFSVESNDKNIGEGAGFAFDGGISYTITKKFRVYLGLKIQYHELKFDNGNTQKHSRNGLYNGLQFQF